jgi:ketosteroid isomerase-like protein
MSTTEQNAEVVRKYYDLLLSGQLQEARPFFADAFVLHEPRGLPYGGEYVGFQGVLEISEKVSSTFVDLTAQLIQITSGGDYVIARMLLSGQHPHTERAWSMPFMEEFRFEHGKIAEMTVWYHDPQKVSWAADFLRDYNA